MTQNLAILTGCSAGATVRYILSPCSLFLGFGFGFGLCVLTNHSLFPDSLKKKIGKFCGCSFRTCQDQVRIFVYYK